MTYAFSELYAVFNHPAMGSYICDGEAIGDITFGRANDMGSQDTGADGAVVNNKIVAKSGSVIVNVHQVSKLADWLVNLNNFLENASAEYFDQLTITASSKFMRRQHTATGCIPQKMPDTKYGSTSEQRAFAYLATRYEEEVA